MSQSKQLHSLDVLEKNHNSLEEISKLEVGIYNF